MSSFSSPRLRITARSKIESLRYELGIETACEFGGNLYRILVREALHFSAWLEIEKKERLAIAVPSLK